MKFLAIQILPKLNHKEIENLNKHKQAGSVIKSLLAKKRKSPRPNGFTGEFYHILTELTLILFKHFPKYYKER